MTSCTIIISHYESLPFLRACVRQIRKYANREVFQKIIIADQSSDKTFGEVVAAFYGDEDVLVVGIKPYYSGYGIDWVMRYCTIKTDYICQLHCDAFPIHKNWLYLPIKLIEDGFSFVGQLQFISKPTDTIYPPEPFFAMAQCFNVAKTETYKELSLQAGFTRFHERKKTDMTFENDDWEEWAEQDYDARGSDDDVVAFAWQDKYKTENKLGLSITGMIGEPTASYGRVIEDLVFHWGSARESIGVIEKMPQKYQEYTQRIKNGFDEKLLEEMMADVIPYKSDRTFWDGKLKKSSPPSESLNKRIEELKV